MEMERTYSTDSDASAEPVHVCPGDMHPVPQNTGAFSAEKLASVLTINVHTLPYLMFRDAPDLKMKLWSRWTPSDLETYRHAPSDPKIHYRVTAPTLSQLTNARFVPRRTPTNDVTAIKMTAVVWVDPSMLWGMDDEHRAVCYIFVDNPTIKTVPWIRTDDIAGEGYCQVVVPSHIFLSDAALNLRDGMTPDHLNERVRYWDNGVHKRRSYWCKLERDPRTGHHFAELVVIERSAECMTLSTIENVDRFVQPFAPKPRKGLCDEHGANLTYIESMPPP